MRSCLSILGCVLLAVAAALVLRSGTGGGPARLANDPPHGSAAVDDVAEPPIRSPVPDRAARREHEVDPTATPTRRLRLSVRDTEGRLVAASVRIALTREGSPLCPPEELGRSGDVRTWPVPAEARPDDVVEIAARARAHAPAHASWIVPEGAADDETTLHVHLVSHDRMCGRLVDGAGRPVPPARILATFPALVDETLRRDAYGLWFVPEGRDFVASRRAVVDVESSTFEFALLPEWRGDVVLLIDQCVVWSRSLARPFGRLEVDLDACAAATGAALRVRVDGARPNDDVFVSLHRPPFFPGRPGAGAEAIGDAGTFLFRHVGPGRYEVRARALAGGAAVASTVVRGGGVADVALTLGDAHRLLVQACRPDGHPLALQRPSSVTVFDECGRELPVDVSCKNGVALVDGLPAGDGWVSVHGRVVPVSVPASRRVEVVVAADAPARVVVGASGAAAGPDGTLPIELEFLWNGVVPALPVATYYLRVGDERGVGVKLPPGPYAVRGRAAGPERWRAQASVTAGRVARFVLERE